MPAKIISGTEVAKQIREELKLEIDGLRAKHNLIPGLATVLLGDDPASRSYVAGKEKTALALGLYSERINLPVETSEKQLLTLIKRLNNDPKIHGILVQLPLPKHTLTRIKLHMLSFQKKTWMDFIPSIWANCLLETRILFHALPMASNSCWSAQELRLMELRW